MKRKNLTRRQKGQEKINELRLKTLCLTLQFGCAVADIALALLHR